MHRLYLASLLSSLLQITKLKLLSSKTKFFHFYFLLHLKFLMLLIEHLFVVDLHLQVFLYHPFVFHIHYILFGKLCNLHCTSPSSRIPSLPL